MKNIADFKVAIKLKLMDMLDELPYIQVRKIIEHYHMENANINSVDEVIDEIFKDNKIFDFVKLVMGKEELTSESSTVIPTSEIVNNFADARQERLNEARKKALSKEQALSSGGSLSDFAKVTIIESEAGWGQKIDDVFYFVKVADAEEFKKAFNAFNTSASTPDWYMAAL